jgi:hypothetical protein
MSPVCPTCSDDCTCQAIVCVVFSVHAASATASTVAVINPLKLIHYSFSIIRNGCAKVLIISEITKLSEEKSTVVPARILSGNDNDDKAKKPKKTKKPPFRRDLVNP